MQKTIEKVENKNEIKNKEKKGQNKYQLNISRNSFENNKINEYNEKLNKTQIQENQKLLNNNKNKESFIERKSQNSKEDSLLRKIESQKILTKPDDSKQEKKSIINFQKKSLINKSPIIKSRNEQYIKDLNESNMKKEELVKFKDSIEINKEKKIKNYFTEETDMKSKEKINEEKDKEEKLRKEEIDKEKLKKKKLLEKVNISKESLKDNLNNKYNTKNKNENIKIHNQKSSDEFFETETNLQNRASNQKIINFKKSLISTNSSDIFSTSKNNYQRQYSQESNSKLSSSTSGKDKIYNSYRYSKIRNTLRETNASSLFHKSFKTKQLSIKNESNDIIDIIENEKGKIANENMFNKNRKSEIFKNKSKKQNYVEESENNNNISTKKLKKSLKINTEENIDIEESNEINTNVNNLEENTKKMRNIQKNQNINDILLINKNLPLKIKIYKCLIYKNTDPDINEETIEDILLKRNKSLGRNDSFILKLPKGFYTEENRENQNDEEKINFKKGKQFYRNKMRASRSSAFFN